MITNFPMALLRFSHNAKWPEGDENGFKKFLKFMRHLIMDIAYRDSDHERSAYAQTAMFGQSDSWWHVRERQRAIMTGEPLEDHERPV